MGPDAMSTSGRALPACPAKFCCQGGAGVDPSGWGCPWLYCCCCQGAAGCSGCSCTEPAWFRGLYGLPCGCPACQWLRASVAGGVGATDASGWRPWPFAFCCQPAGAAGSDGCSALHLEAVSWRAAPVSPGCWCLGPCRCVPQGAWMVCSAEVPLVSSWTAAGCCWWTKPLVGAPKLLLTGSSSSGGGSGGGSSSGRGGGPSGSGGGRGGAVSTEWMAAGTLPICCACSVSV